MQATSPDAKPELPAPRVIHRKRRSQGWVWLIPIIAVLIGLSLIWHEISNRGPKITISFRSASGLEEGKTQIRYRDVVVGTVIDIRLSDDRDEVLVDAQLDKDAEGLANEGTSFWVVRPSIGLEGVSGLATLFSGSYIEADTERPFESHVNKVRFVGLETPPPIKSDRPGRMFRLRADSLGSLNAGSPIYFLRIPVGIVTSYELDEAGKYVDISVFIDAPYDKFVKGNTRFWNESGIYVKVSADGLTVRTESLASIIAGGLAFASFGSELAIEDDHLFKLYASRDEASQVPTGVAVPVVMKFERSARGLEVGAPIDFQGIHIGVVDSVELEFDRQLGRLHTHVTGTLYPARLGPAFTRFADQSRDLQEVARNMVRFVDQGLRAQMRTASILSGSSYISLGYQKSDLKGQVVQATLPFNIPTVPSESLEDLQKQIGSIISHLEKIPFESIGKNLDESLKEITQMARNVDQNVTPELTAALQGLKATMADLEKILSSSENLPGQVERSLQEMDRAVRSTRALIDELRAKPNAIIFGETRQPYSRETLGEVGP